MEFLKEVTVTPDQTIDYNPYRESSMPIIIDNGALQCRVGFGCHSRPQLVFRNLISKQRGKKDSEVLVGNDITNLEAVKWLLRSPFESNVVTQVDVQEIIWDYVFSHLGIDTECVDHPIVVNEAVCVPLWSRTNVHELLFECYRIPSLMSGIDSLFSLHHNCPDVDNCLVISLGHYTCHILPIIDGKLCPDASARINLGGLNLTLYLQRLLQLKYPKHTPEFTFTKCEHIVQHLCRFATHYDFESNLWSQDLYYEQNIKQFKASNSKTNQMQHSISENFTVKSQRLLSKVETNLIKKREKQLIELEERRKKLKTLQELVEDEELADPALVMRAYQNAGVNNLNELRTKLNELTNEIKFIKTQLNPKLEPEDTVIDEIKEWQKHINCDESKWISYVRQLRANKIGENAWILNELLREYELESKRLKRHGISDNIIELGPELIRVPELLFSPNALINYQQCGITEALENVIQKLDNIKISETIFLTGGCANIDGLLNRVQSDVTSIRPFQSPLSVKIAQNPSIDSWKGERDCANAFPDKFITKSEYLEFGSSYIKEFKCSNLYTQ